MYLHGVMRHTLSAREKFKRYGRRLWLCFKGLNADILKSPFLNKFLGTATLLEHKQLLFQMTSEKTICSLFLSGAETNPLQWRHRCNYRQNTQSGSQRVASTILMVSCFPGRRYWTLNSLKHSGNYIYRRLSHSKTPQFAHRVYLTPQKNRYFPK